MILSGKKASLLLFAGDIATFILALFLTLIIRYGNGLTTSVIRAHLGPFAILFALWAFVFYLSGLYGKRIIFSTPNLADALIKTQIANIILAALFFFLVPSVGIAPKTNLIIYLVVSLALILLWRLVLYPQLSYRRTLTCAALIASGSEADEFVAAVNANPRYGIALNIVRAPETILDTQTFAEELTQNHTRLLIVDSAHVDSADLLALIYRLTRLEGRVQFVTFEEAYEEIFDRIPLSRLEHGWFLENVAPTNSATYNVIKRSIDIIGGLVMGLLTLIALPFIYLFDALEGPGAVFIRQERLGQGGQMITSYKFRSMRLNKSSSQEWTTEEKKDNPVTKVGGFLRNTSLDEFPQFINVLAGELSLIGPRNDIAGLGKRLAGALPYYEARYLVKPGITGWAQVNQQYEPGNLSPQSIEETKVRLAYDFYYLKHRSLGLDLVITLKTIKRMFFRVSSW
jgi:lipopolysaccharide/colanic/teichoic acid biosynthesis glycosyltransferase